MKNNHFKTITLITAASVGIIGCNPLNKMAKKAELITYEVTPNPLEMHADSISISISGKYPEKFFHKKANVKVTPVIRYAGGEKALKETICLGEAAEGEGTKIAYAGGSFNFTDKIAYEKGMEKADVVVKAVAGFKTKTKEFGEKKIGDGTKITPYLIQNDEKPLMGKDQFTKTVPRSIEAQINYLVNSSQVAGKELTQDDIKALTEFVKEGAAKGFEWKGLASTAYASPDGEITLNENLANDRAKSAANAILDIFKKNKVEAAKNAGFATMTGKGEDWDGFKRLMQESSVKDKDLIIRVLEMYTDLAKRETEIKNMAATYVEVADKILPQLRRSQLTINADEKSKSDDEIKAMVKSAPDSLTIEEILYAATLTTDINEQLSIYQTAARVHAGDWRGHNNVGYIYLLQSKVTDAEKALEQAKTIDAKNAIVNNNLGVVARWKGDKKKALEHYKAASGAGSEVSYNLGVIDIMNGDYAGAVSKMGSNATFNAGLAKLLNGDNEGAIKTVDNSDAKESGMGYYLKAIAGARNQNKDLMINNLKAAIGKDSSLKAKAKDDAEFLKFREDADFKGLVN